MAIGTRSRWGRAASAQKAIPGDYSAVRTAVRTWRPSAHNPARLAISGPMACGRMCRQTCLSRGRYQQPALRCTGQRHRNRRGAFTGRLWPGLARCSRPCRRDEACAREHTRCWGGGAENYNVTSHTVRVPNSSLGRKTHVARSGCAAALHVALALRSRAPAARWKGSPPLRVSAHTSTGPDTRAQRAAAGDGGLLHNTAPTDSLRAARVTEASEEHRGNITPRAQPRFVKGHRPRQRPAKPAEPAPPRGTA
jgi:hypothetical protein